MRRFVGGVVCCAAALSASADEVITLESALARARVHAPALRAAQRQADEAAARLRTRPWLDENPVIEGAIGDRRPGGSNGNDFEIALRQPFALGGRRGAQGAAARAGADRARAELDDERRVVLRETADAYCVAVAAEARLRLARDLETGAGELVRVAERRLAAGDIAAIDVNTARAAAARATAEALAARGRVAEAHGRLRVLLDLAPGSELRLGGSPPAASHTLADLLRSAEERADVRAAAAEVAEAEVERRLGSSAAWPELTPAVRYEREDGVNVLWAGASLSLPLWNRGQRERAVANVRAASAAAELEARRRRVRIEIESAWEADQADVAAVQALEAARAAVDENDQLARRSYEEGQIGLLEVVLVRREGAELRAARIERQLEADRARLELEFRAGVRQ